ncbi:MAG: LON peptidase substrate-binding domain-containing protein [Rhodobiaceae bacterium]|nr:LON peptidase substrate-binding domain-containing protein [Rhodobiaceae bacterium]MCC0055470.1 LON peptidase substrate-binding domain-containing protein [Rhodobiaceae bacterium]
MYYSGPESLPSILPVFPLAGALLLPRGDLPLNIFEPRYLAMIDHALAGQRVIGMIQPDEAAAAGGSVEPLERIGCAGRLTAFMETGDGRYLITLTGISRFRIVEEMEVATPFRQCRIDAGPYARDFTADAGNRQFNRERVLEALRAYLSANNLTIDWDEINRADNEILVNSLSMAAPYGVREKQALLEAADTTKRAELLIALTERELGATIGDATINLQ